MKLMRLVLKILFLDTDCAKGGKYWGGGVHKKKKLSPMNRGYKVNYGSVASRQSLQRLFVDIFKSLSGSHYRLFH